VLRLIGQYRPLLFFGVPRVVVLFYGFGRGMLVIDIYNRTRNLAVGYAMIGVLHPGRYVVLIDQNYSSFD
jgi:hypothetical protein